MKIKIFVHAIFILLLILLETTVLEYIRVMGIKPNLLLVYVVSVALLNGNVEGAAVGFFSGLTQDLLSGRVIGFYALLGLYLGLIMGSVNKRLYRENLLVVIIFTFAASAVYEFFVCVSAYLFANYVDIIHAIRYIILPESIYNSIVAIFIYIMVIKVADRIEEASIAKRKY